MTNLSDDPLSQLIVNTEELDRKKLAELLDGYCAISKDGQIRPISNFPQLDSTSKVLAIILAQKAAKTLGLVETDQISPSSIEEISGLPGGTVRVKLMELRQQRIVDSTKGSYSIPNHSIIHVRLNTGQNPKKGPVLSRAKTHVTKTAKPDSEELKKLLPINQEQIGEKRLNLLLSPGKYLERALAVLTIAREIGIEALTPNDITRFMKEKIRVNVIRENISLALGRGTKYVDRSPSTQRGVYSYRIMVSGDQLLERALKILSQNEGK
ncbi:MAG: hypothetical protein UV73_C0010G0048 [Candidatus Gottesmanbacteria bacterium GW2011_GWA2_43_14]|uniref:Uncharacterized protein n=1 Tax=Candidatus Gottesmanbacteria bacterium GW2011_GWA2_43_14 TaxID=1618443 RepID=A0A0G1GC13_9BACT|nr:MAG: hypothetical protein UV73_C0010G0048 [Candidatus Gottesmanbacteria bacterium GW2011_GWA2_43_14]